MGSLPDLTERSRPAPRVAVRTVSDPQRKRNVINQIPVRTIYRKEWPWRKQKASLNVPTAANIRRKDSVASSVGAASVRRLIIRQPTKLSRVLVRRFTFLCASTGLCATALLPFTAFAGAEAGAIPLAIMHTVAAVFAPFSPFIIQKIGVTSAITVGNSLVCVLIAAHIVAIPLSILLPLYGICGAAISPMGVALAASATNLAQGAGDESRRKIALRRALRALRAGYDLGLVFGSMLIGCALMIWSEESMPTSPSPAVSNISVSKWPPSEEYFLDDDYEEKTCGAAGCPETQTLPGTVLNAEGRKVLVAVWTALALVAVGLGVLGAASTPSPPPDDARSVIKDIRTLLGAPMGLFIGLQQGFIFTSYIKWYGVCVGGWGMAWRALWGAGALQALAAGTASMAAARGRRSALAAGGAAAHASLLLALVRWRAARTDLALPAVAAAAWAACAALWDVLHAGICIGGPGWRGPWSVALSARHAGFALACVARHYMCARAQLAVLGASFCTALASHAALEIRTRRGDLLRHRS